MFKRALSVVLVVTPLLFVAQVQAEDPPAAEPKKGVCKEEIKKFCADVKPGGGRVHQCLNKHENELSQACRDARTAGKEKAKQRAKERHDACAGDVKKLCADVQPGDGRIHACLKKNRDQVSEACRATFPKRGPAGAKPAEG
ncbi:MAG: cysteine rich repeat-containing protein [Pseudomonadota bacterium]